MSANQNFSVKWNLAEVNSVRRALVAQRDALIQQVDVQDESEEARAIRADIGNLDTILRRDL